MKIGWDFPELCALENDRMSKIPCSLLHLSALLAAWHVDHCIFALLMSAPADACVPMLGLTIQIWDKADPVSMSVFNVNYSQTRIAM